MMETAFLKRLGVDDFSEPSVGPLEDEIGDDRIVVARLRVDFGIEDMDGAYPALGKLLFEGFQPPALKEDARAGPIAEQGELAAFGVIFGFDQLEVGHAALRLAGGAGGDQLEVEHVPGFAGDPRAIGAVLVVIEGRFGTEDLAEIIAHGRSLALVVALSPVAVAAPGIAFGHVHAPRRRTRRPDRAACP